MAAQPEVPLKKKRSILTYAVFAIIICCVLGFIISQFAPDTNQELPPTEEIQAFQPPVGPTQTPIPEPTLSPEASFEAAVLNALGSSNRDVNRITSIWFSEGDGDLVIEWTVNDNFSNDWILSGAMSDITDVLEYIATNDIPYPYQQVTFDGTFPLVDQFGNSSEERVILVSYTTTTIQKINWEGFLTDNIFNIADGGPFIHPALQAE